MRKMINPTSRAWTLAAAACVALCAVFATTSWADRLPWSIPERAPRSSPAQARTMRPFPLRRMPLIRNASSYAGLVTTLSGPFNVASAVTYDPEHKVFYVAALNQIDQVTLSGATTKIASFSPQVGGLTYDSTTHLIYVTDQFGSAVDTISLTGVVTLLAGGTHGTNDGQGASAQFQGPTGITLDSAHQLLYVADVDRVRVITTGGAVTTLTLPGSIGQFGGASCCPPPTFGLTFDSVSNELYVADGPQNTIDVVTPAGAVSIFAGRCFSFTGFGCAPLQVDGPRLQARFAQPSGLTFSPIDRGLYITESGNNDVRRISPTGIVTTLAGSGIPGNTDGLAILASFQGPGAVAIDPPSGTLMVADVANRELRTVTTVGSPAPSPPHGNVLFDPPTQDSGPSSIAVTADGTVWFTEQNSGLIGRRTTDGRIVEFLLPPGRINPGNMIVGPDGAAWFTDSSFKANGGNAAVAKIAPTGVIVEYPVPNHNPFGSTPVLAGLTVGPDKNLWFTDPANDGLGFVNRVGKVTEFATVNLGPIVAGFDGNLWATGGTTATASIWRYATTGRLINTYTPSEFAYNIGSGPDSAMWFAAQGTPLEQIGHLTTDGKTKYFDVPPGGCIFPGLSHFMTGPNKNVWFIDVTFGACGPISYIAQTTTVGAVTLYPIFAARSSPSGLAFAPDGTVWFADQGSHKIGKLY